MINNNSNLNKKGTTNNPLQLMIAGVFSKDNSIEAFGIKPTRSCVFYQNGKPLDLKNLPKKLYQTIYKHMVNNTIAYQDLKERFSDDYLRMQEYIFCMWGQSDHVSDFQLVEGSWKLSTPENFVCGKSNCHCTNWKGKEFRINGVELTSRDVFIIRQFYFDYPDKQIAASMGIAESTLNTHKRRLFNKLGAPTKSKVLAMALQNKVI